MKDKLYKKEILVTIVFSLILLGFGHFAQLFKIFPALQGGNMWGFPVHYILPILMGWFGLLVLTIIMAVVLNKFDDDMDAYTQSLDQSQKSSDS
ncbi:MAG: hypothetical protein ACLFRE_07835 [Desulfovermiculus sp.]